MSESAGADWAARGEGAELPRPGDSVHAAIGLLNEALELTRSAAERIVDREPEQAVELLAQRDRPFAEAGEMLGRLGRYADTGGDGLTAFELALLRRIGTDLGRLDAQITGSLRTLHGTADDEFSGRDTMGGSGAAPDASPTRRRLDGRA